MRVIALVLLAIVGLAVGLAPLHLASPKARLAGKYIVMYHKNVTAAEMDADLLRHATLAGVSAERTFRTTIRGYSGAFDSRQLALIRANPKVALVEEDQVMNIDQSCTVQNGAGWGLTRVSQRELNLDDTYHYPGTASGVTAYIIDTGVYVAHSDFQGRARFGFKAENGWSNTDGNGHGTHVASTVGGRLYGVAKGVQIVAVKVLSDGGSGSTAGVIAGVEWAAQDRQSHNRPSVGNMSLGGGYSATLNAACDGASQAGVLMVVAAGNEDSDACNRSPASATDVISTGATTTGPGSGNNQIDVRSYFSNWGTCVALFAPGSDILGAWIGGTTATRTISGTSMASPHVCGVAALALSENPGWNFASLRDHLTSTATPDVIDLDCDNSVCNRSPNLMVYNGCR